MRLLSPNFGLLIPLLLILQLRQRSHPSQVTEKLIGATVVSLHDVTLLADITHIGGSSKLRNIETPWD